MLNDPELEAMSAAYAAVKELEPDSKRRVVVWLFEKCGVSASAIKAPTSPPHGSKEEQGRNSQDDAISSFSDLATCFGAAGPKTEAEKALIAAAYLQEKGGKDALTGFEVNRELTHMGHALSNVTVAMTTLISQKPQLVAQLRKEGKTKQAKKKYRVTGEGLKKVQAMIASSKSAE
jgi:hypothetical protein